MLNKLKKMIAFTTLCAVSVSFLSGCALHDSGSDTSNTDSGSETTIAVTSVSIAEIMDLLELDLSGVPTTDYDLPERYADVQEIGSPMSPDMEILSDLNPDWVLSPVSLKSDLQEQYEQINVNYAFLNLNSVQGMMDSISDLGELFDRVEQANAVLDEYDSYMKAFEESHEDEEKPTVLVLMGFPGSYSVATDQSYVGSLVELAGGMNVYSGEESDFITVNTEDMLAKDPDIILRTSHALPDQVSEMFAEEFETNDIWSKFDAVSEGNVYDLTYGLFGMSADLDYQEALEELEGLFYGN